MALKKNEHGLLVRAQDYGKASYRNLAKELDLRKDETLYVMSQERGARVSRAAAPGSELNHRPGTSFVAGPTITKAANPVPRELRREMETLRAAGLGAVSDPEPTRWGWAIRLKGFVLPGGSRTDAMILLPEEYPVASPIGFYLRKGAFTGGLDTSHLYGRSYHNAPELGEDGWNWYCGVAERWIPGRHDLLGYVAAVLALLNERSPM